MPQQFKSGTPTGEPSIDPITYSDETIFGLDPAVHWVAVKGPGRPGNHFPQIVADIANHWKNREWLVKLLERHGYNDSVYHPDTNRKGIFSRPFKRPKWDDFQPVGLPAIRVFVLRAAGVNTTNLQYVFGTPLGLPALNLASEPLQEVAANRKQLIASLKKST